MKGEKVKRIGLRLIFVLMFVFQISAQSLLKDGKIPDDLLITLKRQEGWGGTYSEMTINANGEFSSLSRGGNMPPSPQIDLLLTKINGKPPKYLKSHLSEQKLKLLIVEFEKIQFFKFSDNFPDPNEENYGFVTDSATEGILIRINGQTKEVSNYLGNFNKRRRILEYLAEKIRGAGIWNYENGEIPENFEVSYQLPDAGNARQEFKIRANGEITQSVIIKQPFSMKVKKVGRISKKEVKEIIDEFEKIGFSVFRFSNLLKHDGCLNEPNLSAEKRKQINVQINYILQMYASLYENCNAKPETNAAKFEYMENVIENLLKKVGAIK